MKCPMCDGSGSWYQSIIYKDDMREDCDMCRGSGSVPIRLWIAYALDVSAYNFVKKIKKNCGGLLEPALTGGEEE